MEWKPRMWPTFAADVLRARAALRLTDEVGLAFRAERQRLGMSQRAYATHRGWTLNTVIRLESAAGAMKLGDVDEALNETAFQLCLCHRPPHHEPGVEKLTAPTPPEATPCASSRDDATGAGDDVTPPGPSPRSSPDTVPFPPPVPQPVHPAYWPRAELIARVRGGGRRFPAHHVTEQVGTGPPWWWYAESSRAGTVAPDWYAPQFTQRRRAAS